MKIENKVTLKHLKQNMRRTIITILGIVLSVSMFTTVICAGASFLNFYGDAGINRYGDYHFYIRGNTDKTVNTIKNNSDVDDYCFEYIIADSLSGFKIEGVPKYLGINDWLVGEEKYFDWMTTSTYEGEFPKNEHEVMLPRELANENKDWQIGNEIEISTIFRYLGEEGFVKFRARGNYSYDESYDYKSTDTYKIVGISNYNQPTGRKILRGPSEDEKKRAITYVRFKDVTPSSYKKIIKIFEQLDISPKKYGMFAGINDDYLNSKLSFNPDNKTGYSIMAAFVGVLVIILIASVVLIYNAFQMSYAEKVRYLGMLSSIGATKTQRRKSTYFEALVLGGIGVPLGFIFGIGLTKIATSTLGKLVIDAGIIEGAQNLKFSLSTPIWALALIAVLSFATIFASVFLPAKKASEITPIEAIRQKDEFNLSYFTRSPWLIKKIFGYEGILAYKNLKRNGRKGRLISVSIILSVVLILVTDYACAIAMQSLGINDDLPYQVSVSYESNDFTELEGYLDSLDEVDRYYKFALSSFIWTGWETDGSTYVNVDDLTEDVYTKKFKRLVDSDVCYCLTAIEDEDFNQLCRNNGIDPKPYYHIKDDVPKCIVMNNISHKENTAPVFTDKLKGKRIWEYFVDSESGISHIFSIFEFGDLFEFDKDNYACRLDYVNNVTCLIPCSVYEAMHSNEEYKAYDYGIETKNHAEITKTLEEYLDERENYFGVNDIAYWLGSMLAVVTIAKALVFAFIIMITLITVFNIINTISTNVELRRKEFAMLKSVGTTPKGFKKMLALESIFYALRALIAALPLSVGISVVINHFFGDEKMPFEINWPLYLIVSIIVFIIVIVSMLLGIEKTKNTSIIDALKEDIM